MKRMQLTIGPRLRPLKTPSADVPHAVLESNYTCNRRCTLCYNLTREIVKPLDQLRSELDSLCRLRRLETVSILGGEPTLHPDLPAIVRMVKGRGVYCQVLTNGIVLFRDGSDALLDALVAAGIDRIVLHVDCGQGITAEEMDLMTSTLFGKFERRGVFFAISSTLYRENVGGIPALLRRCAQYPHFDGMLATLARPGSEMAQHAAPAFGRPDMADVDGAIRAGLRVEASSYIPSSLDDEEIRWLMYLYYINARTGATVPLSPAFVRLMRSVYRRIEGRNMFAAPARRSLSGALFLATAIVECLLRPSRIPGFAGLLSGSLRAIRFHSLIVQSVPDFNAERGCVEICYHCPDATVRDGRLAPVCLADHMSPPGMDAGLSGDEALSRAIHAHLEES
ncbi:MAG TPA: radical SAM protein [Bacteroidota bacterium]|nr:radical SAM protein [Bacteroidota bacterium]